MRLDRNDIVRKKMSRTLIWVFQMALVLLWLALADRLLQT